MRDIIQQIHSWLEEDKSLAVATVIKTWGSSPRQAGASMAVCEDGRIAGSVSGGCVEGAVVDSAIEVIRSGKPERLHFGVADEQAWQVGLSCGGEIDVFVRPFRNDSLATWQSALFAGSSTWIALVLEGEEPLVGLEFIANGPENAGDSFLGPESRTTLQSVIEEKTDSRKSQACQLDTTELQEVFLSFVSPAPELILVGGAHIAIPLADFGKISGFDVTVIDPRKLFSTGDRFPEVKLLLTDWPEKAFKEIAITESTAVVMLTHDPKIDDPAIKIALQSPAFYIGALGSRKTHQQRIARLQEEGVETSSLARINAPVGLDLGAITPEEIALSIMAEIVLHWRKRSFTND